MKKKLILLLFFITTITFSKTRVNFNDSLLKSNSEKKIIDSSRKYVIQGKVIDKLTKEIIPYCSIVVKGTSSGTSTNELGYFFIEVNSLPIELSFTHVSFKDKIINISNNDSEVNIELTPLTNVLEEVKLKKGTDWKAVKIAKLAFEKSKSLFRNIKYGKALYRQKAKNGDEYSELSEIIYDVKFNNDGIKNWEIIEGRYAIKEESINNKNYTFLTKVIKQVQPYTDDLIFPLQTNLENIYNVNIVDEYIDTNKKIIVLNFKTKKKYNDLPSIEGDIYIDNSNYEVLKIEGQISKDNLKFIKLQDNNSYKKNHTIYYEMAFKQDPIYKLVIDYIRINQDFDYYKNNKFKTAVSTNSNLTFFEYYSPSNRKKLGYNFNQKNSDWENINKVGYNKKFWEENAIIKRTPIEENVIADFEKDNAFESIFINSRGQIDLMQSNISNSKYIKELDQVLLKNLNNNIIEKVYLHTDKDTYVSGETMWFGIYNTLSFNTVNNIGSELIYVDLIDSDNKVVASQTHKIKFGKGNGSYKFDQKLPSGNYILRAYTNWMRNFSDNYFFHKKLKIINTVGIKNNIKAVTNSFDVQFFPEGGYAIENLPNRIAFKAIDINGLPIAISGNLINAKGTVLSQIKSKEQGAGYFTLIPKPGEKYSFVTNNNESFPVENIKKSGYSMLVNNLNENSINVKIKSSNNLINKPFYIIGHLQNQKYFHGKFNFTNNKYLSIDIPKNKIPSGVFTISILDEDKNLKAERVVFINKQNELTITTNLNTKKINKKEKLTLDVSITDTNGKPIETEFSISINDADNIQKNNYSSNILTHLLLESDMKGYIKNPALFFKDKSRATLSRLDLIMLTHGWRKIKWAKTNNLNKYPFTSDKTISGSLKDNKGTLLKNVSFYVLAKSISAAANYEVTSDNNGQFVIDSFNHSGKTELKFIMKNKKYKKNFKIVLDDRKTNKYLPPSNYKFFSKTITTKKDNLIVKNHYKLIQNDSLFEKNPFSDNDSFELDVIDITGKSNKKKRNPLTRPSTYNIKPNYTIKTKDRPDAQNINDLLNQVPGYTTYYDAVEDKLFMSHRNGGAPIFVIDGITIGNGPDSFDSAPSQGASESRSLAPGLVMRLNLYNIERIEVLSSARAALFGGTAKDGVILIYTKKNFGNNTDKSKSINNSLFVSGNTIKKEFYTPKYSVNPEKLKIPDYRTSLYWNANQKTDKNGKAKVTFYNSDITQNLRVVIEALSSYGVPGTYIKTFSK